VSSEKWKAAKAIDALQIGAAADIMTLLSVEGS
jgi:hypothetical protein